MWRKVERLYALKRILTWTVYFIVRFEIYIWIDDSVFYTNTLLIYSVKDFSLIPTNQESP
jgi:hypothetical protein